MQRKNLISYSLVALALALFLSQGAQAQYWDRNQDRQAAPEDTERDIDRKSKPRRGRADDRKERRDMRGPRSRVEPENRPRRGEPDRNRRQKARPDDRRRQAQPNRDRRREESDRDRRRRVESDRDRRRRVESDRDRQRRVESDRDRRRRVESDRDRRRRMDRLRDRRRTYERRPERRWHRDKSYVRRDIYVPRRWHHRDRPHYRRLWKRRYSRVWWCGFSCRIGLLFGFTHWTVHTVVSYESPYSFPIWEALEYNATGETSLWESGWGYVEFTPTRTFKRRFRRGWRDCRDFVRIVVRNDGFERRYYGTACRSPRGSWWIVS